MMTFKIIIVVLVSLVLSLFVHFVNSQKTDKILTSQFEKLKDTTAALHENLGYYYYLLCFNFILNYYYY